MNGCSLGDRAYEHIRAQILSGHYGNGRSLSELSIARELGISRTPIRDAIRRLAAEGLVEQIPRMGTLVRKPTRREIENLYGVRIALESYAVRCAAERLGDEELATLERLCAEMRSIARQFRAHGHRWPDGALRRHLAVDMAFHMVLMRAAGNERMMKIIADSRMLTRMFVPHPHIRQNITVVAAGVREHYRIFAAVRRRDREGARRAMETHIERASRYALAGFDQNHAPQGLSLGLMLPAEAINALADLALPGLSTGQALDEELAEPEQMAAM